jgi:hypothetical protein
MLTNVKHEVRHKETGERYLLIAIHDPDTAVVVKQDRSFAWCPLSELESIDYPDVSETEIDIRSVSGLSSRAITALLNNNIFTVGELQKKTFREVQRLNGVGPSTASDIRETLRLHGWSLKPTTRDRQVQQ